MKKIAYIELDTHAEIAGNFMELMYGSKDFEVDYYFSARIIRQIGQHHSNILLSENTELLNQLKEKNYDLIIIGTVHRFFNLFNEITRKFNTSVIVHNLNFINISKVQLFKNIFKKDFTYRLKLWLKEDLLSAPEVFKNANNLLVLDESLAQDTLKYLPVFFNQFQEKNNSQVYTVVIPGAVSQARRDYDGIFSRIFDLEKKIKDGFKMRKKLIEFVFLGKAKGNELKKIINLERSLEGITIRYFSEKVPQNLFDIWMNKADILWCPIQSETEFFSNQEVYGKTKMSGNVGDAIKYGKTAFFPKNYQSKFPFILQEDYLEKMLAFNSQNSFEFQKEFNQNKISVDLKETLKTLL